MAKESGGGGRGGGGGGGIVSRAGRRGGVLDRGNLSRQDRADLRAAVRQGKLIRTTLEGDTWYIGS